MHSHSSSKLTTSMLTQLQQNEYLRVKLIQLEKVSREKDNFYLSIFRQQELVTEKVLSELFLAEDKIKELIRARICNNWQEEYDTLAQSISFYVKDVNSLIQEYQKTKSKLQQKAYNSNDLYQYYSNTLEECGKKFDQAQIIIEELNNKMSDLKETILELDQTLQIKITIIEEQNQQIEALRDQIQNNSELQNLKRNYQSSSKIIQTLKKNNKKLQKDNQAFDRSIHEMEKIIQQLKKQSETQNKKIFRLEEQSTKIKVQNQKLIEQHLENIKLIEKENNQIKQLNKTISQMSFGLEQKPTQLNTNRKNTRLEIINISDQNNKKIEDKITHPYNFDLNQLHLKKILEQQQIIKAVHSQINYLRANLQHLQSQKQQFALIQIQNGNNEKLYRKQIQNLNSKLLESQLTLEQNQNQISKVKIFQQRCTQEVQQWKLEVQGLYQQIANHERQVLSLRKQTTHQQKQNDQLQKQISYLQDRINTLENRKITLQKENKVLQTQNIDFDNQNSILQERLRIMQNDKLQSKHNFQKLLEEFHQFVQQAENQKNNEMKQKISSLSLSSFQLHEALVMKNKLVISHENQKMKKKKLTIDIDHEKNKQKSSFNEDAIIQQPKISNLISKGKKFNLQSFQQINNPYLNMCYSPKIGDIFNSMQHGRKIPGFRW